MTPELERKTSLQLFDTIEWLNQGEAGATTSYHKWLGGGLVMLFVVFPFSLLGGL